MASVLIVILNWNGLEDTLDCVKSLQKQTYKDFDICIVDNNSKIKPSDDAYLKESGVIFIDNAVNLGFAGGVNVGIKYGIAHNYQYVSLLNNDAIVASDWLEELIKASVKSSSSITTGLILDYKGSEIDSAGEYFSSWGISFPGSRDLSSLEVPDSGYVFGASGGAVLYRTALFKEIGLFDETFFVYFEDADINFRSQLSGNTSYFTNSALVYHKRGATSRKVPGLIIFHTFKNLPLVFWKNVPTKLLLRIGVRLMLLYTLFLGNAIKNGSGSSALKGALISVWYFWTSILWKRFKIQRNKKVTASHIWSILYHDLPPKQTGMRRLRKLFIGKD